MTDPSPFGPVEAGLAARVDLARPALVRAYVPVLSPAAVRDAVAQAERELGHHPTAGAVDHLAGDADRAGWALRAPVARPEATDLDRHRLPPVAQRRRRLRAVLGRIVDSGRENRCRLK